MGVSGEFALPGSCEGGEEEVSTFEKGAEREILRDVTDSLQEMRSFVARLYDREPLILDSSDLTLTRFVAMLTRARDRLGLAEEFLAEGCRERPAPPRAGRPRVRG